MIKFLTFVITLGITSSICLGQQLNFTNFSVSEGLAQSQVYSITETDNGELLIATQGGGLSIFDGKNFTSITKNQGLKSNNVNVLHIYGDSLLIGTDKGLNVFYKGQITHTFPLNIHITVIKKKSDSYLIGSKKGVYLLRNGKLYQQKNVQLYNKEVSGFFSDSINEYWVTTNEGIYSLSNPFKRITTANGLPSNIINCVEENNERIILGTDGEGIVFLNKSLKILDHKQLDQRIQVKSLLIDKQTRLWIGTQNQGVFRIYKNQMDHFTITEGLPNNYVKSFYEDHWGNIWIGSFGGGISRFTETQFVHFDSYSGLNGNYTQHILSGNNGKIWTSSGSGGLSIIQEEGISNILTDRKGENLGRILCFDEDENGSLWLYEEGRGLRKVQSTFSRFASKIIETDYDLREINDLKINKGYLYVATKNKGILKARIRSNSKKLEFDKADDINTSLSQNIDLIEFDQEGRMWIMDAEKGLAYFKEGLLQFIGNTNNLNLRSISFINKTPILGTNSGIYTIEGIHLLKWKNNARLSSENIYQILVDLDYNVWVGTEQGLDKISNFLGTPNFNHFGPREGFQGLETTPRSSAIDQNGDLWFGTVKGVEKYAQKVLNKEKIPPLLSIKEIRLGYVPIQQTEYFNFVSDGLQRVDTLIIPFNKKPIEIELSALDLTTSNGANFTHILEGFDEMWSPITKRNNIVFNNLPPGEYILRYKTGNSLAWTPVRSIRLIITPPYYSSWWFIVLMIIGFVGIIYLSFRIALTRLRKNNLALKENLELERKLVEVEQKALRLQMNPHFLFNVLQSVQEQIIKDDKNKARLVIAKFAKLMRSILENSREKYISIEEEIQTVEHYMKLEQLIKSLDFSYTIDIDEELDVNEEIIPPLLIQPFIENSIIHGFKNIDRKPQISIKIILETENNILISIDDNGCGRQKSQSTKSQVDHLHKSLALQVTQERLSILDQNKNDKPLFAIIDKEENGLPMGTRIELRIGI